MVVRPRAAGKAASAASRPAARAPSSKNRSIRGMPVGTTRDSGMPNASA